jgi:leucyl aminopeptidase
MITIKTVEGSLLSQKADCFLIPLEQDFSFTKELQAVAKKFFPDLKMLFQERKFIGKAGSSLFVPVSHAGSIYNLVFIGLGKRATDKHFTVEQYRRMLGRLVRVVEQHKYHTVALELLSPKLFGVTAEFLAQQTAIILDMAAYNCDSFFSDPEMRLHHPFEITLVVSKEDKKDVAHGVANGMLISDAVNKAREWMDAPPDATTPQFLAEQARSIAKKHKLKITVFDEKQVNAMGMGGLSAVARGSERDCQLVIMEYKTAKKGAPTISLVGKGITFDSGGLSIKPANAMETMKYDMSGAAAVISSMSAIAALKPDVNVIGIAPITENLPSGTAIKPGDVATFYNGKTAEIKNTDAEGRLILADALSYTVKHHKPDAIIDFATLTGACAAALGPFYAGLLSNHDELVQRVQKAADITGERVWRLPFDNDYKPAIKSEIADMANIGSQKYMAGTITAAFFLKNFVADVPWVHLDIAGVAYNVPDISYYRNGSTGFGVRLIVEMVMNWQ